MICTFSHLVTSFFVCHLKAERALSDNTIASYSDCMRLLVDYACKRFNIQLEKLGLECFTPELIMDFLDHIEKDRDNLASSRNQRLAAIKSFFHFLARQVPELMQTNEHIQAIRPKKTDHLPPPSMTVDEVKAIIAVPDTTTLTGACDSAMLQLLYNTGARVQELANLRVADLRLTPASAPTVILTGKGRKQRVIPLWPQCVSAIEHYLQFRATSGIVSAHLFLSIAATPLTRFGIGRRIEQYVKTAAKQCPTLCGRRISPHVFRHTTALHLIENGNDITIVKDWLGHADLKTTSLYIEVSVQRKRQALETFPAPGQPVVVEEPAWKCPSLMDFLKGLSGQRPLCCNKTEKKAVH